jgi:hypothetical protein
MKKIVFIAIGILLLCACGFVFFANSYFNSPTSMFQIRNGVNPKWALLMLSAIASGIIGIILIATAIEKK